MSDREVTRTLNEIRERVRVQLRSQIESSETQTLPSTIPTPNTAIESLRANLSVIERSRSRLPPVTSYRRGWIARLELSIKRFIKRITHWFTWEQVNFNAATANALQEVLALLASHEKALAEMRGRLEESSVTRLDAEIQPGEAEYRGHHFDDGSMPRVVKEKLVKSEVDAEIRQLAARLEELRAARLRMD